MNKNNLILYFGILIFGLAAPFLFPAFKVQLSILCVLIVLALLGIFKVVRWVIIHLEIFYFMVLGCILCISSSWNVFSISRMD